MSSDATIRAERARQLLDDPLIQEALAALEADAIDALADTDAGKFSETQALVCRLQAVRDFRQRFASILTTGAQAERPRPGVA
jgi:hypothetical protein